MSVKAECIRKRDLPLLKWLMESSGYLAADAFKCDDILAACSYDDLSIAEYMLDLLRHGHLLAGLLSEFVGVSRPLRGEYRRMS
jgi:hypothetical protein